MNSQNDRENSQLNHIFLVGDLIENPKKCMTYRAQQLIGKGSFGQVIYVQASNKNQLNSYHNIPMAMKIFKKLPAYINRGLIQINNLRQIAKYQQLSKGSKKNYLNLYDAFMWKDYLCIAMQLLDNSLLNILQSTGYQGLEMKWIQKWSKQIILSLAKIHALGIIHCDIKPQNLMFRSQQPQKPLLIDFSSSCSKNSQLFTYIQSRFYRSPQVLIGIKPYTQKIDIWSLGCMLAQMYLGLPLFPGGSAYDQIAKIYKLIGNRFNNQSEGQMIKNSSLGHKYFQLIQIHQPNKQANNEQTTFTKKKQHIKISYQFPSSSNIQITLKTPIQYTKVQNLLIQQQTQQKVEQNKNYFNLQNIEDIISIRNPLAKDLQVHQLFLDLLKKMLVLDPNLRISAQDAFLHPFIGGIYSQLEPVRNFQFQFEKIHSLKLNTQPLHQ